MIKYEKIRRYEIDLFELMDADPDLYMTLTNSLDNMRWSNPKTANQLRQQRGKELLSDGKYREMLERHNRFAEEYYRAVKIAEEKYNYR